MLFLCDTTGNENAEVADRPVDRVDDRLPIGADLVDALVEIENPSKRLLRRRDVVALRAEHHDGRTDIAQINRRSVGALDSAGRKIVADEQLIDNELDLLGIEIDVTSPPALESEITRCLGVDLGIEIVLLGPQRVCVILVLEIVYEPRPVELA